MCLDKTLSDIKNMPRRPDSVFMNDSINEAIAVAEARRLVIPVISIVDTNCDPDVVDYVIPGNDDALRAIRLFAAKSSDSVLEGQGMAKEPKTPKGKDGDDADDADTAGPSGAGPHPRERTRAKRVEAATEEEPVDAPNEASAIR